MAESPDSWIHNFTVTDCQTHRKGFTVYKITSILFPVYVPESLTCLTVWKRYNDVKKLRQQIVRRHREIRPPAPPVPKLADNGYFRRFDENVIRERRQHIMQLLDYIARHPTLYKSHAFVQFFADSQTPPQSPNGRQSPIEVSGDRRSFDVIGDDDDAADDSLTLLSNNSSSNASSDSTSGCSDANDDTPSADRADEVDCALEVFADDVCSAAAVETAQRNDTMVVEAMASVSTAGYIFEAALELSEAVRAESTRNYRLAFDRYKAGIGILIRGVRSDACAERRRVAKDKISKYILRAEQIYACHLQGNSPVGMATVRQLPIAGISNDRRAPFEQLGRLKVLKVMHGVMQVQCPDDRAVYVVKVVDHSDDAQRFELNRSLPGMVELVRYYVSDNAVYLLLQQANGGRLWDYMQAYRQTDDEASDNESTSLNRLFTEPVGAIEPSVVREDHHDDIDDDAFLGTLRRLQTSAPADVEDPTTADNNAVFDQVERNAPAFEVLQTSMDVDDLLNCSQKLLRSVSTTIERSNATQFDLSEVENPIEALFLHRDRQTSRQSTPTKNVARPAAVERTLSLDASRQIPPPTIRRWASELFDTIRALHANGIVCGDLHANNLLLGSGGRLQMSYFYRRQPLCFGRIGTVALDGMYLAPERPLTMESDWWSFGVLLFEMLTGKLFADCHPGGPHSYGELQWPGQSLEWLAPEAVQLVTGCVRTDVVLRFDATAIREHAYFAGVRWDSDNDEADA